MADDVIGELNELRNRLVARGRAAGHRTDAHRPADGEGVRRLSEAIAPRELHPEARWLWEHSGLVWAEWTRIWPEFCDADFARSSATESPEWPRALIPVCYSSHCFLVMELVYEDSPGPWLYTFEWAGSGFRLAATGLGQVLQAAIDHPLQPEVEVDMYTVIDVARSRLPESIPAAEREEFDYYQVLTWPARWQRQQGVDASTTRLRGPTHTIAQVQQARRHGPVTATILGTVRNLGGSAAGTVVSIDDGTGALQALVPASVPSLRRSPTDRYELDVEAEQIMGSEVTEADRRSEQGTAQSAALRGDRDAAAAAGARIARILGSQSVVATAQRPV